MIWGYEEYSREEREKLYCQRAECKYNNMTREGWVHNACDYCVQTGKSRIAASGSSDWKCCKCFEPGTGQKADAREIREWMERVKERDRKRAEKRKREAEKARKKKKYDRMPKKMDRELAYKLWQEGKTDEQAAEIMGVKRGTYAVWRQQERLVSHNSPPKMVFNPEEARALYDAGANDADIGRALNVSSTCIRNWRVHAGLPTKFVRSQTARMAADLQRLYKQGMSDEEIAAELGCTKNMVGDWRRSISLRPHTTRERAKQDKRVMELLEQGMSVKEIASRIGLDRKTVYGRLRRMGVELAPSRADERDIRGRMYSEGATDREIAEAIDTDARNIAKWRFRNGLPVNKKKK